MKNIFITGGAGFIGSHVAAQALAQGFKVTVFDDLSVGRKSFLPKSRSLKFIKGDILNTAGLAAAIKRARPDVVIHLAAIHHIPTCERYPERTMRVNIEGTQSVLRAAQGVKRIVFASTGALYQDEDTLRETTPKQPRDIYGFTKFACEQLLELHARRQPTQIVMGRLFNTVGPHETNQHIIPDILAQLVKGKRTIQLGNMNRYRDYVHVRDVARALLRLATARVAKQFDVFNIGTGREHSVRDIVALCERYLGHSITVVQSQLRVRKNDRLHQCANIRKITTQLGWRPRQTLADAIREMMAEQGLV
ncbi:MAG: GDP-mannose 4,6-dehydratase [Candidatus Kerfeldbacteria bacterium]|nr:GDP-mannose 4,6-dehydratase [Candidatus Kerfeldbacteria bacterium]